MGEQGLGGVLYETMLPFEWRALEQLPDRAEIDYHNDNSLSHLQAINVLETGQDERLVSVEHSTARLEYKLDLALDLLARLVTQQQGMPGLARVRLGSEGVEWSVPAEQPLPAVGAPVTVALYLLKQIPTPLTLFVTIEAISVHDGAKWVLARYQAMGNELHEALIKLIFRHHRRSIAQARASRLED